MNIGAQHAAGDYLLFLHGDTSLPDDLGELTTILDMEEYAWGRFDMRLSGQAWVFRMIESCMNLRSRISGVATGDQAIFVHRKLFEKVGAYPEIALMEDVAMSKKLRKVMPPICLRSCVMSSSRRWEQHGIIKMIVKMWLFRLLYFFGYDTQKLARHYR